MARNQVIQARLGRHLHNALVTRIWNAEQEVLAQAGVHQAVVLGEVANVMPQHVVGNLRHVEPVDQDLSLRGRIEA